jgi:4-diphosphocytidyl-2-C-methyl-D-erythritol kinase
MTGSGPTVFGIFDEEAKLKQAYDKVKESGYCPELFMSKPVNPKY